MDVQLPVTETIKPKKQLTAWPETTGVHFLYFCCPGPAYAEGLTMGKQTGCSSHVPLHG